MPDRAADVTRIVKGGRARGLSDDQIRALVARYDERQPRQAAVAPQPDSRTRERGNAAAAQLLGVRPGVLGMTDPLTESIVGAAKGALGTGYNILRGASLLPGIPDLPPPPAALQPRTTSERVGHAIEQGAEFLAPAGLVKAGAARVATAAPKLATAGRAALEGLSAGSVAAFQGGNPLAAAATAGVGSAVLSKASSAAPALKDKAQKLVVQALGPTKERYKAMAARLAPEMLKRGIKGSRGGMQARAADAAATAGQQIDDALRQYGTRQVGVAPVVDALETAKDAFRTTQQMSAAQAVQRGLAERARDVGKGMVEIDVVFEPRAVRQLTSLQGVLRELGDEATVDQLVAVRRAWDSVVDQAGGFAHRSGGAIGIPLKEQTEAWAKREATSAIRKLLAAEVPDLAAVNKEYAFWKSLDEVLTQTMQRTQPHGPGLAATIAKRAGQGVGGMGGVQSGPHGVIGGAVVGGEIAQRLQAAFTSPRWKLLDASVKNAMADALLSGNPQRIASQLVRVGAYGGSRLPQPVPAR